jgi:hypothetical protein
MRRPKMLDEADIDDPVERPLHVAIIHQFELHLVRDTGSGGAFAAEFDLVGRKRDAEHFDAVVPVQIEC